jgi:hypothetical protein
MCAMCAAVSPGMAAATLSLVTLQRLRILLLLMGGFLMGSPCNGGGDDGGDDGGDAPMDGDDGGGGDDDDGDGDGNGLDTDGDGTPDADDACPIDPSASAAGPCQLTEACAIVGDAEGTELSGDPALAHAGRFITLEPGAACGEDFDFEWVHGAGSAAAVTSREREDFFLFFAREQVEMRLLYEDRLILSRTLALEAIAVPVAGSMIVDPIKPKTFEQATIQVSAITPGMFVPITDAAEVATVDYELLQLEDFLPAGVVFSQTGTTTSSFPIPPQPVGWYMARAVARDADGNIVATPLPASFEFVP